MMSNPIASFSLSISTQPRRRGNKKLVVYIWKNLKDLRQAAKSSSTRSAHYWKNAAGAYVGIQVYAASGRLRQYGEIHLWEKLIGAGYFAHELQHFMDDYAATTEKHPLDSKADERMAWLAGELTYQFWTKFYERFDVKVNN